MSHNEEYSKRGVAVVSQLLIQPLTREHLSFGEQLSSAAGWNQLPADWQRVLDLEPTASFVMLDAGRPIGTVTAIVFDAVAWVGLMLVEPARRGQGIGRALMERVLAALDDRRVSSVRLDATPLGKPLYEKLGFRVDYALHRFAGAPTGDAPREQSREQVSVRPASANDLPRMARYDEKVTSTRRAALLDRLFHERQQGARTAERARELTGFVLERAGRLATQIGPCLGDATGGAVLLRTALHANQGSPVFVDIPDEHLAARSIALQAGLTPVRRLTRMTRGPSVLEAVDRIWASSGPEKG